MSDLNQAMQEARKLARTPEGKQLAARIQQLRGDGMQQTLNQAAAGDLTQAKQLLATLMQDPEARMLLEKLGGGNGN